MSESLQSTRHTQATYNRPNQKWICGRDCDDCPCHLGPDSGGRCQAGKEFDGRRSGECLPRKRGDRWICTRQELHGGEPCESGPLPDGSCCREVQTCQPKRSIRSRRGQLTLAFAVLTVAWLVVILQPQESGEPSPMISGGELSSGHSFIGNQCSKCHSDLDLTAVELGKMHGDMVRHRAIDDGKLCLSCHDGVGGPGGSSAFLAHTSSKLTKSDDPAAKSSRPAMKAAALLMGHDTSKEIACATCHQEHHGSEADIKTLTDKQCQVCHQQQFEGFGKGHPEFCQTQYPYSQRTGIRFDHYSHYQAHFPEEQESRPENLPDGFNLDMRHGESVSCNACHVPGSMGESMKVLPFEQSCGACHGGDTTTGERIPFLGFPSADLDGMNGQLAKMESPRSIGTWIEEAPESFPWPVIHLLSVDARSALAELRKADVDPFEPSEEALGNPETLKSIEKVLWGFKELAHDLSQSEAHRNPSNLIGHDELIRRLSEAGFEGAEEMFKGIPPDAFDAMRRGFSEGNYVRLLKEVEQAREGSYPGPIADEPEPSTDEPEEMSKGLDEDEGFGGDEEDEGFGGGEEDEGFGGDEQDEGFGGNEEDEGFGNDDEEGFGDEEEEGFGDDEEEGFGDESEDSADDSSEGETEEPKLDPIDPGQWASKGGWQQQYGVLYYRATGHADPLIKSWLDGLAARASEPLALAHLKEGFDFQSGVSSVSSGSCLKCHAVDEVRDPSGQLTGAKIRWASAGGDQKQRKATRFDHAPHLILTDCRSCHETKTDADDAYLKAYPDSGDWNDVTNWSSKANPLQFQSNFKELDKKSCSVCHDSTHVGDQCTQCHLYHHDD
ncbi:hypothetical protein [Haloferula sp.]|uniref:hypothetical protein n=1 Tax=Haloferula sp. TaxID=2497595 RepID=UPI00329DFE1D